MIKKLYLLRHSESGHPKGVDDHNRPINANGKQECKIMNSYVLQSSVRPEVILCSDAVRTQETARAVFSGVETVINYNKKLYQATPGEILKEIAKVAESVNSVAIVAHNPGIGQLAKLLAGSGNMQLVKEFSTEYPTCSLTEFSFDIKNWGDVEAGKGRLENFTRSVSL